MSVPQIFIVKLNYLEMQAKKRRRTRKRKANWW